MAESVQDVLAVLAEDNMNTDCEFKKQIMRQRDELMNDTMVLAYGIFDDTQI